MFTIVIIIIFFVFLSIFIVKRIKQSVERIARSKKFVHSKDDLPFHPKHEQVIYVESKENPIINNFIKENYDKIQKIFYSKGFSFFYLDNFINKLKTPEFYSYNFPNLNIDINKLRVDKFSYSELLSYLMPNNRIKNGLIRCCSIEKQGYRFSYYKLHEKDIWKQLNSYESLYGPAVYSKIKDPKDKNEKSDFYFDFESKIIIDEIKQKINELRIIGIEEMFIKSLFELKLKLSKLLITKDFKIYLYDYNKEINMHPLPKAVYFLFINHPEGILFKQLPNYKKELFSIYKNITNRNDIDDVLESINDITDPTKNAINEKCSRIRSAFLEVIAEDLAKNYYITGRRGEPKKIILDRTLLEYK